MTKRFLIIFFVNNLITLGCFSQNISSDEKLLEIVRTDGQATVIIPLTDSGILNNLTRNVSILSVENKKVHISLSPLTIEWFISQKFDYSIVSKADNKGVVSASGMKQAME